MDAASGSTPQPPEVTAYVGLGANLGDALATLKRTLNALARLPRTRLDRSSSFYRTAPVDAGGPDYVNAVACLQTALGPYELLGELQRLEQAEGRERPYRNAPRTLDLDLLTYGTLRQDDPTLTLPHPEMQNRAFVLMPLAEIAPDLVPPQMLRRLEYQAITVLNASGDGES